MLNKLKNNNLYDIFIQFSSNKKQFIEKRILVQLLKMKINYKLKNDISKIGCGGYFSYIFNNKGINSIFLIFFKNIKKLKKESIFFFGKNDFKQLGIENIEKVSEIKSNNICKQFKIDINKIKKISCGLNYTLMLIESLK
jgi:hypothetical protein